MEKLINITLKIVDVKDIEELKYKIVRLILHILVFTILFSCINNAFINNKLAIDNIRLEYKEDLNSINGKKNEGVMIPADAEANEPTKQ